LAGLLILGLAGGCALLPPMGWQGRPFTAEPDEERLWTEARREAEILAGSRRWDGAALEAYLAGLAARLVPDEARAAGAPAIGVLVLRDPALAAFALPHGLIVVHTGLLARLENPAQLAMVLAHEVIHVTHRHALGWSRERYLAPPGEPAPLPRALPGLVLAQAAAVTGYGPRREAEADARGWQQVARAGYDLREGLRLLEGLRRDLGPAPDRLEVFLWGNPSLLEGRASRLRRLLGRERSDLQPGRPASDAGEFTARMRVLWRENALLDLRAGRFDPAWRQLGRALALDPGDARAHLHAGDLHRLRSQRAASLAERQALLGRAREAYERAARLDPALPDPYRQLGLLHYQARDGARAAEAFRRYLALSPEAPDARRIREYVAELAP
jgi:predicted Zn-dependent protease